MRIRNARESDLDALADYEVVVARVSFGDKAVDDPVVHRNKLAKALARDVESMFVAADHDDRPIGWLWLAINTNFLTGERYANFRTLAVSPGPDSDATGHALLERALDYAREHGIDEVTGRVHMDNLGMRLLYRRFGFDAVSLTMRARLAPAPETGAQDDA